MQNLHLLHWCLAGFFSFVAVFYTSLILLKKHSNRPVVTMGARYSCHWWNHLTFRVFRSVIWLVSVAIACHPPVLAVIMPFEWLSTPALNWSGVALLIFGFTLAVSANFTLGKHWRSGIIDSQQYQLVQKGLYGVSRNPGYMGVAIAQVGFLLALPSLFSLICLLAGLYTLNRQTLLEEDFLRTRYPTQYPSYQRMVPRWISL